ncbi:MAG TPA: ATP synthase F1 subunit epsilon [Chthoniobacterales bacterium]|jgi:F-type H+-transporting ATPase subunit epsilon|nr:ATP synthase F1 subunit epsilon [Chthoniobacterales bacterium]
MAKLQLEIVTPEAKTFSEEVDMVVLPGVEGELGILPLHVPLMTRLLPGEIRITQGQKQVELVVGNGFVEVMPDKVSILTDMAMSDSEVDEQAAEEAIKRAQAALQNKSLDAEEVAEIESALARSLAQLRFKRRRHRGGA